MKKMTKISYNLLSICFILSIIFIPIVSCAPKDRNIYGLSPDEESAIKTIKKTTEEQLENIEKSMNLVDS